MKSLFFPLAKKSRKTIHLLINARFQGQETLKKNPLTVFTNLHVNNYSDSIFDKTSLFFFSVVIKKKKKKKKKVEIGPAQATKFPSSNFEFLPTSFNFLLNQQNHHEQPKGGAFSLLFRVLTTLCADFLFTWLHLKSID